MRLQVDDGGGTREMGRQDLESLADRKGHVQVSAVITRPGGTHASFESSDGEYRASIPLDVVLDKGRIELDAEGLRLSVVDGDTLCWNVKDLASIRVTDGAEPDSVPENPPH